MIDANSIRRHWFWTLVAVIAAVAAGAAFVLLLAPPFGWGVAATVLWITMGCLPGVLVGKDGLWSTSKFQLFLWIGAIGYCLVTFVAFRCWALQFPGAPAPMPGGTWVLGFPVLKDWMWVALGMSMTTSLTAKGITIGNLHAGRLQESKPSDKTNQGWLDLISDDSGTPEIMKVQMLFWTVLTVVFVVYDATATLNPLIASIGADCPAFPTSAPSLPELPVAVLILTGLGQGVYLGDKLFDSEQPRITGLDVSAQSPGQPVTVFGANFGSIFEGQRVELSGSGVTPQSAEWSDTRIVFKVPDTLAGQEWPKEGKVVSVRVFVRETASVNESKLTVLPKA